MRSRNICSDAHSHVLANRSFYTHLWAMPRNFIDSNDKPMGLGKAFVLRRRKGRKLRVKTLSSSNMVYCTICAHLQYYIILYTYTFVIIIAKKPLEFHIASLLLLLSYSLLIDSAISFDKSRQSVTALRVLFLISSLGFLVFCALTEQT